MHMFRDNLNHEFVNILYIHTRNSRICMSARDLYFDIELKSLNLEMFISLFSLALLYLISYKCYNIVVVLYLFITLLLTFVV